MASQGFRGGSVVKNLPALQETQVPSLGREDSLEEEMPTHSNILVWETPGQKSWRGTVHEVTKQTDAI